MKKPPTHEKGNSMPVGERSSTPKGYKVDLCAGVFFYAVFDVPCDDPATRCPSLNPLMEHHDLGIP